LPFHNNINPLNWAPEVAKTADAVIAVVGVSADMEGEEVDAIASADRGDRVAITLPQNQVDYVKQLAANKKGPLILVVAAGSPVDISELHPLADAILWIWYPGEQGGNAVADVIFGDTNPSGHLPVSFVESIDDLPPFDDYAMAGRTYKFMYKAPLYPFGFGLSYSQFKFGKLSLSKRAPEEGEDIHINVEVENNTSLDGETVVQVYLSPQAPLENEAITNLKAFKRIHLAAHEKRLIELTIKGKDLYRVNDAGEKVWPSGAYTLAVGDSLPSKRSIELGAAPHRSQEIHF
tara:strand:- start:677 stop:1549 length:873 start_codon:yes stop_codon:yes gene_type:complete